MRYVRIVTPYSLVLLLVLTGALLVLVVLRRKSAASPSRRFERQAVIRRTSGVWFLGLESEGGNIRGPGTLILARDGLHFQARTERRELFIPGSTIVYLGCSLSFRERTLEREALIVHYLNAQGRQEEAGFRVPAPGRWAAAFKAGLPARNAGHSRRSPGNRPS